MKATIKVAKGAQDQLPDVMSARTRMLHIITDVFESFGAVQMDTPVFERSELLKGNCGAEEKLMYDLADQGGEALSLRYDLTVPLALFLARNGITSLKRYQVGKVYRRDNPRPSLGRFREFVQCDFDVCGTYEKMVPDAEVIAVIMSVVHRVGLKATVRVNHRMLLESCLLLCGVSKADIRPVCSCIDKLDKVDWETAKMEMVECKRIDPDVAEAIGGFVNRKQANAKTLLSSLREELCASVAAIAAIDELDTLFDYCESLGVAEHVILDMGLARGLDYYTGPIFEAVLDGGLTVAGGGRYDGLVGRLSGISGKQDVPCVGCSIGFERICAAVQDGKGNDGKGKIILKLPRVMVLVASIGEGLLKKRMHVASILRKNRISVEYGYKANPKLGDQLRYADVECIPFVVIFGEDEIRKGTIRLKDMYGESENEIQQIDLIFNLRNCIRALSQ
jgi:histidyl-tRNA synthetase